MKKTLLFITTCLLLSGSIHSQVTIGSGQRPVPGALLDLKTETDGSSKLGLGMPRVELSKLKPTTDAELAASIGNATGSYDMDAHIGLIVYNVKDAVWDPATCKMTGAGPAGLYVWDGTTWQGLGVQAGGGTGTADPLESETATTLTDREGNTYPISTFGTAGTWMTENLRTTKAPGLTAMTESAAYSYTDMYYAYPNGGSPYTGKPGTWTTREGILYNWQATMNKITCATSNQGQGETTEQTDVIQGICPFGWHVPSDKEWNQLEQIISEDAASYAVGYPGGTGGSWTETYPAGYAVRGNHGMLLLSNSQVGGGAAGFSKPAGSGGLDLLLAGIANGGSTSSFGTLGYLWSASSDNGRFAWYRDVISASAGVWRFATERNLMFSVRCKKN